MLEKHPNRKKDKYNPYTLTITEGRYYLSFKDRRGKQQNTEIDEVLYQTFNRFELEDIVSESTEYEQLHRAVSKLPKVQRRRLKLYFFGK